MSDTSTTNFCDRAHCISRWAADQGKIIFRI
jgi:hypothetical protein